MVKSSYRPITGTPLLAALACVAAPAIGQGAAVTKPLPMEVAGVRLAMPVVQAETAATAAGYRCSRIGGMAGYAEKLRIEVARRRGGQVPAWASGSEPNTVSCKGPNGETLTLGIVQAKAGSIVQAITFMADPTRIDVAAIERRIRTEWPRPTRGEPMNGEWCSPACGRSAGYLDVSTFKTVSNRSTVSVFADRGSYARKADEAELKADADRLAPASRRAAF